MRRPPTILKHLFTLIAAAIFVQCGASLAMAVHAEWHEEAHHHEDEEEHDCPVVQLVHGLWDAPLVPVFAVPRPPLHAEMAEVLWKSRQVPALILSSCVLEHAPPVLG